MKKILILFGPTAVGKSSLAMALAKDIHAEIICADSGQVYQGFDIGTAKPSLEDQQRIPHHCLDLWEPNIRGDAVMWVRKADEAIEDCWKRYKVPLIVGGTGFYLKALLHGVFPGPDPEPALRKKLQAEFEERGGLGMHQRLSEIDPSAAQKIHPNDPVRLIRALETFEQTGKPLSTWQAEHQFKELRYDAWQIGLIQERTKLYQRIEQRTDEMIEHGWGAEAFELWKKWGSAVPPFQLIGYREWAAYFDEKITLTRVAEEIKKATRRYAKRQLTWMKTHPNLEMVELTDGEKLREIIASKYLTGDYCL